MHIVCTYIHIYWAVRDMQRDTGMVELKRWRYCLNRYMAVELLCGVWNSVKWGIEAVWATLVGVI